jgi:HlyD family secretion protein
MAVLAVGAIMHQRTTWLAPDSLPVRVAVVDRGRVEETVTNSRAGTVKARRRAKLSPEAAGRVVSIEHGKGSAVARGQVLLRLDDAQPRARLALAEKELSAATAQKEQACQGAAHAERDLVRTKQLAAEGLVAPGQLDQVESAARTAEAACQAAEAGVGGARSAVVLARSELDNTVIRAPFDGVLAELQIEVGEWTSPSPPGIPMPSVLEIIDPSSLYISAPMDEVDSARIAVGQDVRVTVDSHPGQALPGTVDRVAPYVLEVEAQNRTVEIDVTLVYRVVPATVTLLPGTSADVEVILAVRDDVLRIPTTALMQEGTVLAVDGDRLVEKRVDVGIKNWDFAEVRGGLTAGERIVTSLDRPEVKAGAHVRVENQTPP